jgi:hypothetical protein
MAPKNSTQSPERRKSSHGSTVDPSSYYNIPDNYANLNELATPGPVENPAEQRLYRHLSLEDSRSREQEYVRSQHRLHSQSSQTNNIQPDSPPRGRTGVSCWTCFRSWFS